MLWLDKARTEAPHRREIWLDLAEELHNQSDWLNLFWACTNGIEKTYRTGSYLDDSQCWGFRLFDLGAIAAWHLNAMDQAVEWGGKALEFDPGNQRLENNLDFFVRRRDELRMEAPLTLPRRERRSDGTIVESIVDGQSVRFLVTNPNDAIMKFHYSGSFYEMEELALITRHYTGEGVFVDIGANVGNHSVYMSRFSGSPRIIPFEPNQAAISILKENLALNQCQNVDQRFLGIALAARKTRLKQVVPDPNNLGHTCYYEDASGEVSAVNGDALILNEQVEFIKIDVEGMEIDILSGLEQTIKRWRPTIFVEVWDNRLGSFVEWCERESYKLVERFRRYDAIQNYLIKPLSIDMTEAPHGATRRSFETC
jgi:FkbM family methyltransferase